MAHAYFAPIRDPAFQLSPELYDEGVRKHARSLGIDPDVGIARALRAGERAAQLIPPRSLPSLSLGAWAGRTERARTHVDRAPIARRATTARLGEPARRRLGWAPVRQRAPLRARRARWADRLPA